MAEPYQYVYKPDGGIARLPAGAFEADQKNLLGQGYKPIPDAAVPTAIADMRAQKLQAAQQAAADAEAGSLSGIAKTGASAVARGAFDAATAPVRGVSALASGVAGTADPLAGMTGREALETGAYVAGGQGLEGAKNAQQFAENERTRARVNPGTEAAGYIGGSVLGAAPLAGAAGLVGKSATSALGGGLGARLAGAGVTGALEGAPLNLVQQQDQAYVEGRQLTGEQALAAMGTGALIGGVVGAGARGLGEVFAAGKAKVGSYLARKAGEAAETVAPKAEAAAESAAAERIGSAKPKTLADTFQAATGQEALPETPDLIKQGFKNHGDLSAVREGIHGEATETIAKNVNDMSSAVQKLSDKVDNKVWKLGQVEQHAGTFAEDALEQAQARSAAMRQDISDTIEGLGKTAPDTLKGLKARLDAADLTVQGTKSAAKANIALDQARRELYSTAKGFERSAGMSQNVDTAATMKALSDRVGAHYDETANFLMDKGVWGTQGEAQAGVNLPRVDLINAQKYAHPLLAGQVGTEYQGLARTIPKLEAHEGNIIGMVRKLGSAEGAFAERRINQYVDAVESFATGMEKHALSDSEKAIVSTVKESAASLREAVATAKAKAGAVKQAEQFIAQAGESSKGKLADVLGHATAGTSLGDTLQSVGLASNAARQTEQKLAVQRLAEKAQKGIGRSLDGLFANMRETAGAVGEAAKKIPTGAAKPVVSALELFQGKHATPEIAYQKRVEELVAANANYGQQIREGAGNVFGTLAAHDPHAVSAAVVAGTKGVQALMSLLPVGTFDP